jgi:hypothetical protein
MYNDEKLSDITLCFGDNKIYAHKMILMGSSGVFSTAFSSNYPVASGKTYDIQGHSDQVVLIMLQHIYGFPMDPRHEIDFGDGLGHLFDIFLIANEYSVPSLAEAVTRLVVEMIETIKIDSEMIYDGGRGRLKYSVGSISKQEFRTVIGRTVELYRENEIADKSLLEGVNTAFTDVTHGHDWIYSELGIEYVIQPFAGILIREPLEI